ncbi:chymotrypsin inhibitor-like [Colletes gigas]|uniref:chymotrypsin inhibitor-like n=1 Tax=Colletes gigas TaxID=935657 RepID=UPI001C9BB3EA|nr:chymotrypsin inhibitor-like [Colletes gigas]
MSRYIIAIMLLVAVILPTAKMDPLCPVNELWQRCGRLCEPSCANPNPTHCPRIECTVYTAACRCQNGYVRQDESSSSSPCISPADC